MQVVERARPEIQHVLLVGLVNTQQADRVLALHVQLESMRTRHLVPQHALSALLANFLLRRKRLALTAMLVGTRT